VRQHFCAYNQKFRKNSSLALLTYSSFPKNSVLSDITSRRQQKVKRRFGESCGFHIRGRRMNPAKKQCEGRIKRRLISNGLHGVISQWMELTLHNLIFIIFYSFIILGLFVPFSNSYDYHLTNITFPSFCLRNLFFADLSKNLSV
jgi:hypothetical protein